MTPVKCITFECSSLASSSRPDDRLICASRSDICHRVDANKRRIPRIASLVSVRTLGVVVSRQYLAGLHETPQTLGIIDVVQLDTGSPNRGRAGCFALEVLIWRLGHNRQFSVVQNVGTLVNRNVFILDALPHCLRQGVDGSPVWTVLECLVGIHRDVV
jgi:hypothetical protein